MDTDALLVWKMKRGDKAAMDTFVRRYYPLILRYCQYRLSQSEDAEDLTQETFVRFFSALPEYTHHGKALNYLYTISGNLCRDYYRAGRPALALPSPADCPAGSTSPTDQIDNRLDLMQALNQLPEELREVIILYYFQGLKQTDVSKVLGIGLPLVKYRIRHAKELLQAHLSDTEKTE